MAPDQSRQPEGVPQVEGHMTYSTINFILQALEYTIVALKDPHVRTGRRLALVERGKRICRSSKNKHLKKNISEFTTEGLSELKEV